MREIILRNGMACKVSSEDYERLNAYRWGAKRKWRHGEWVWYAQRMDVKILPDGERKPVCREMQREVLDPDMVATRSQIADHINHDTLDNQRHNLRWLDRHTSQLNTRLSLNNTSGYRGVSLAGGPLWRAALRCNGTRYISYGHTTAESAARAYNELARLHHGTHANLNIILGEKE